MSGQEQNRFMRAGRALFEEAGASLAAGLPTDREIAGAAVVGGALISAAAFAPVAVAQETSVPDATGSRAAQFGIAPSTTLGSILNTQEALASQLAAQDGPEYVQSNLNLLAPNFLATKGLFGTLGIDIRNMITKVSSAPVKSSSQPGYKVTFSQIEPKFASMQIASYMPPGVRASSRIVNYGVDMPPDCLATGRTRTYLGRLAGLNSARSTAKGVVRLGPAITINDQDNCTNPAAAIKPSDAQASLPHNQQSRTMRTLRFSAGKKTTRPYVVVENSCVYKSDQQLGTPIPARDKANCAKPEITAYNTKKKTGRGSVIQIK